MASALTVASVQTKMANWHATYTTCRCSLGCIDLQPGLPPSQRIKLLTEINDLEKEFIQLDTKIWIQIKEIDSLPNDHKTAFATVRKFLSQMREEISRNQTKLENMCTIANGATPDKSRIYSFHSFELNKLIISTMYPGQPQDEKL